MSCEVSRNVFKGDIYLVIRTGTGIHSPETSLMHLALNQLAHYYERWMSKVSDTSSFETWEKKGSKSMDEVAKEKIKEILATHKPEPIPEDVEGESVTSRRVPR